MDEVRQSSARLGYQLAVCPALNVTFKAMLAMTLVNIKKILEEVNKIFDETTEETPFHIVLDLTATCRLE
jgi:hypothetical protein